MLVQPAMSTPYRDDQEAAQEKLTALEDELRSVRARKRELAGLDQVEARLDGEAEALRRKLQGMRRRSLPLLDAVRIASPCKAEWDEMVGDGRSRFCSTCQKNVYDLSGMAREEAESFVRERSAAGGACIRLHRRHDGTVLTADCPVGLRRKRLRRVVAVSLGAGLMALTAGALWGRSPPFVMMGDMDVANVPPPQPEVMVGVMMPLPSPEPTEQPPKADQPSDPRDKP